MVRLHADQAPRVVLCNSHLHACLNILSVELKFSHLTGCGPIPPPNLKNHILRSDDISHSKMGFLLNATRGRDKILSQKVAIPVIPHSLSWPLLICKALQETSMRLPVIHLHDDLSISKFQINWSFSSNINLHCYKVCRSHFWQNRCSLRGYPHTSLLQDLLRLRVCMMKASFLWCPNTRRQRKIVKNETNNIFVKHILWLFLKEIIFCFSLYFLNIWQQDVGCVCIPGNSALMTLWHAHNMLIQLPIHLVIFLFQCSNKMKTIVRTVKVICGVIFILLIQTAVFGPLLWKRDISSYVREIRTWNYGIKFAVWDTAYHYNAMSFTKKNFNEDWKAILKMFGLSFCHAVDIGANDGKSYRIFFCLWWKYYYWNYEGDTTLNLAEAINNRGRVVAFEMGPSFPVLQYNIRCPEHSALKKWFSNQQR